VAHTDDAAPLLQLLTLTTRRLTDHLQDRVVAAGFDDQRIAHHQVLALVPRAGIRLTDLAERAGMTKQAMAELVDDLEGLGYLRRTPDPDDRRAKRIALTKRGRAAGEAAVAASAGVEAEVAERISPKRLNQLRRALLGVLDDPGADDPDAAPRTPPA
jgi:DNA-binding MarR family transcriptional regulator